MCIPGVWFHGVGGDNAGIHLSSYPDTSGAWIGHDNPLDRHESIFAHEVFHNLQDAASYDVLNGRVGFWPPFGEGTAVLATAVTRPDLQIISPAPGRQYPTFANRFLNNGLNASWAYGKYPYGCEMVLYWRFLYEQCGGITSGGGENPSAGMAVVWAALEEMYRIKYEYADTRNELVMESVEDFERAMNRALKAGCLAFADSGTFQRFFACLRPRHLRPAPGQWPVHNRYG